MTQQEFNTLAKQYNNQTSIMSFRHMMVATPGYKQLVELGDEVVPFILRMFQNIECGVHWFIVLEAITGSQVTVAEDVGSGWVGVDVSATQLAWLNWGRGNGRI